MAEAWAIKAGAAGLELRCRHPRPVRALLTEIELHWADGQQQRIERPSKQRGSALIGPLATGRDQPERIEARLDLGREMDGLRRLAPSGEGLKAWLASLRSRPRRWRGLVLAASCGDPCITVAPAYDDSFLPLLLRLALLEPVEDPALGVLMAFSRKGRRLHSWLQLLGGASGGQIALLRLSELEDLDREGRLLALSQLAGRAPGAMGFAANSSIEPLPLLQYWQGTPVPGDIEVMLGAWPALLPELQPLRLDAEGGLKWTSQLGNEIGDSKDPERFQRCWHPAMQSDFLRVLGAGERWPSTAGATAPWPYASMRCAGQATAATTW